MKLLDRVEITEDVPSLDIQKGMTGTIVDINQDDEGIEAIIELDDKFINDPEEDDPIRTVDNLAILNVI